MEISIDLVFKLIGQKEVELAMLRADLEGLKQHHKEKHTVQSVDLERKDS